MAAGVGRWAPAPEPPRTAPRAQSHATGLTQQARAPNLAQLPLCATPRSGLTFDMFYRLQPQHR